MYTRASLIGEVEYAWQRQKEREEEVEGDGEKALFEIGAALNSNISAWLMRALLERRIHAYIYLQTHTQPVLYNRDRLYTRRVSNGGRARAVVSVDYFNDRAGPLRRDKMFFFLFWGGFVCPDEIRCYVPSFSFCGCWIKGARSFTRVRELCNLNARWILKMIGANRERRSEGVDF